MNWPALLSVPAVRRLALAGPLAAGLALAAAVTPALAAQAAPTTTTFYYDNGLEQTYSVPNGVTEVAITAIGAPGGGVGSSGVGENMAAGGNGAAVTATVPLPPGTTTLYVEVGGTGASNDTSGSHAFNGGGAAGGGSGGGGGATDVRTTSITTVPDSQLTPATDSRLVVAGGGGGGTSVDCQSGEPGGAAGDMSTTGPGNGGSGNDNCTGEAGGNGGFGGTAGGAGGTGSASSPCPGGSGSLGQGGDAIARCNGSASGGPGGGGGYYGGGAGGPGGSQSGGGGAGSSFWVPSALAGSTSMSEDTTGTPEVQITPVTASVTNPGGQTSTVGTAVSLQIQAIDSSGQTLTYSATGLPAGLSINSSTGLISGTPTTAAASSVTVTAKDTTGASGSTSFSWTVNPEVAQQAITFTSTPPSPAIAGESYTPAATGGGSGNPVTFSIDPSSTSGACALSSGTVTFTGAGTCVIDANQAGTTGYSAAPQVQQSVTIQADTPQALAALTLQDVQGSAKFQALPPAQQKLVTALADQAIAQLAKISPHLTAQQLAALVAAYKQGVAVLQAQGWLTAAQAGTLDGLASTVQA